MVPDLLCTLAPPVLRFHHYALRLFSSLPTTIPRAAKPDLRVCPRKAKIDPSAPDSRRSSESTGLRPFGKPYACHPAPAGLCALSQDLALDWR